MDRRCQYGTLSVSMRCMNPTLPWIGLLSALALLLALPAGWLLWRRQGATALAGALVLALLATTSGGLAWHLARQPDQNLTDSPASVPAGQFLTIAPENLDRVLQAQRGHPVLVEFYADWCSSCQVWKQQVFNRADVQAALGPLTLLRIDATAMTPATQDALDRFQLGGLPALISFDREGRELKSLRLLGQMPAADFIRWLHTQLLPAAQA